METEAISKVAIVAKSAEQKSAQALKLAQQSHEKNCNQLDQLKSYKNEYETTYGAVGNQGVAARQLQDYRTFLSKLDQAIMLQAGTVQSSKESLDAVRDEWLSSSRHRSSLDKLLDKRRTETQKAQEKAEQKESDERSLVSRHDVSEP